MDGGDAIKGKWKTHHHPSYVRFMPLSFICSYWNLLNYFAKMAMGSDMNRLTFLEDYSGYCVEIGVDGAERRQKMVFVAWRFLFCLPSR